MQDPSPNSLKQKGNCNPQTIQLKKTWGHQKPFKADMSQYFVWSGPLA